MKAFSTLVLIVTTLWQVLSVTAVGIKVGQPCQDLGQCTTNAECVDTDVPSDGVVDTCKCNENYHNEKGECMADIRAGQSCKWCKVCVPNAKCIRGTCECNFDCRRTSDGFCITPP